MIGRTIVPTKHNTIKVQDVFLLKKIDFLSRIVFYRFTSHPLTIGDHWRPIGDHSRDLVDLVDLVVLSCLCDANTSSYSTDIPCPDSICLPCVACIPSVTPFTCHRIPTTTSNRIVAAHRTTHERLPQVHPYWSQSECAHHNCTHRAEGPPRQRRCF